MLALPPPDISRSDARLMAQAIRGRWPMSEEMRERVVAMLHYLATADPDRVYVEHRTRVAAAKALLDADRLNVVDEARAVPEPRVIESDGRARVDFSAMSDDELDRYLEHGGRA